MMNTLFDKIIDVLEFIMFMLGLVVLVTLAVVFLYNVFILFTN